MIVRTFDGSAPRFGARVMVAPTAVVVGDVALGDDASVWFGVVLRGDIGPIRIGARTNLQDGVLVHVERDLYPTTVGHECTVGHGAVLHGCTLGDRVLVGMRATILNDAEVGDGAIVAAGAVVREGFRVPPGTLVAGVPATVKRELTGAETAGLERSARNYLEYKSRALAEWGDEAAPPGDGDDR